MRSKLLLACLLTLSLSQELSAQSEMFVSSIRRVDFRNFTYPWTKSWMNSGPRKTSFSLKDGGLPITRDKFGDINGGAVLQKITYGDVTGDGKEEAMIYISVDSGGSGMFGMFYIYTIQDGKPRRLWHIDTGDRANEGFRKAHAINGRLVLELNHPLDKTGQHRGACCPTLYSRNTYIWEQNRFRLKWKRLLPIPAKG
jgi:hypothetical protein